MKPRNSFRTAFAGVFLIVGCGGSEHGSTPATTPPRADGSKTVVVISLDTLRPQRLGIYGNTPGVSPTIDELAKSSVVFEQALATAPWTLPSHASILTGLDPIAHGVRFGAHQLSPNAVTLAERLKAAGFATAAFTDGGFMSGRDPADESRDESEKVPSYGFEQGFDVYDSADRSKDKHKGFARYLDRALDWMGDRGQAPYFLFLHTFDIHAPYAECEEDILAEFRTRPHPDGPRDYELFRANYSKLQTDMGMTKYARMSEVLNDYDAGIREADRGVARVIEKLKSTGRWDDTLFVVLSDHGESFFDHGVWIGHGIELTDDEIHVPLVIKFPRGVGAGTRVGALIDLLDVVPTTLDAAGITLAPNEEPRLPGESLLALARGQKTTRSYVFGGTANTESYFLVRGGFKYITPIGIPPMSVARSHIQPTTPDVLKGILEGVEFKGINQSVGTSYPESFDPLGIMDGLPMPAQLFDRAKDPEERTNLATKLHDKVTEMNAAVIKILTESEKVSKKLNAGQKPRVTTPFEARQLAQLGYLSDPTPQNAATLTRVMQEMHAHPHVPPDMLAMNAADLDVQRVRTALKEKQPLTDAQRESLLKAGATYAAWSVEHDNFFSRSLWRVLELQIVAKDAGVELPDFGKWRKTIERAGKSLMRERNAQKRDELGIEKGKLREVLEEQRRQQDQENKADGADSPGGQPETPRGGK